MFYLQAKQIKKAYGTRQVLDVENLTVYEGDRIGVVGANGAGKSTLLGILSGELLPDQGEVIRRCEVAYLRQLGQADRQKSGGENAKAAFRAQTSLGGAVLLCDEPTANLDADGQAWVRRILAATPTFLLVSHDRALLDAVCTRIVEIREGKLHFYTGNYADYEAAVALSRKQEQEAYEGYVRKRGQLEAAAHRHERKAATMKPGSHIDNSEARLYKNAVAAKQKKVNQTATQIKNRLERLEKVEKPRDAVKVRMDFSLTQPPGNKYVVRCQSLSFSYGDKAVLRDCSFAVERGKRVALTGNNGSGKTTLLRLIHQGHDAIQRAPKLKTGYLHQDFGGLDDTRSVLDNARLDAIQDMASVRSVLAGLLFCGDDVHKKAAVLSGGEKMRLSLAKLLLGDYNALLLDEPTNFLDLPSLEAVQQVLAGYPGTLILVSHDRAFLEGVCNAGLAIRDGKVIDPQGPGQRTAPVTDARRTLLEVKATRLVSAISSAPAAEKEALEREYNDTVRALREMG